MHGWSIAVLVWVLALLWTVTAGTVPVVAAEATGACCFPGGSCEELLASVCEGQGGEFIGFETSCAAIDCAAPVGAPMLSLLGLVSAVGALGGLGLWRLVQRRRP